MRLAVLPLIDGRSAGGRGCAALLAAELAGGPSVRGQFKRQITVSPASQRFKVHGDSRTAYLLVGDVGKLQGLTLATCR